MSKKFMLSNMYHPITSQPFANNEYYTEIQPCEALKPYIRCFWGMSKTNSKFSSTKIKDTLVIPDTCMDIIFKIDMDKNELYDVFAGINDTTLKDDVQNVVSTISCFAIRFYCWAVPLFSDESMKDTLNTFVDVDAYFKNFKKDLQEILISNPLISDRIEKVEQYLLKKLDLNKQNNNVMNAVYKILKSKGTDSISDLTGFTAVSQRQLERLFMEYIGVSPKKLSGLVRYQYLWQDILFDTNFDIQECVYKYGYNDQPHLLKDFKKYHTLSPNDARTYAFYSR